MLPGTLRFLHQRIAADPRLVAVAAAILEQPTTAGFDPGQTGDLPFTGLMLLPLLIVGILVALVGLALRRRLG